MRKKLCMHTPITRKEGDAMLRVLRMLKEDLDTLLNTE